MAKLIKVQPRIHEYEAFQLTEYMIQSYNFPDKFPLTRITAKGIVISQFGREIPYKVGTWFILKGNVWEAKSPKAFKHNYEYVDPAEDFNGPS